MKKILLFLSVMFICNAYADTETVNWYKDGQIYDTTTCQTGSDINLPTTQPTKRGYNFTGWIPVYDFTMLDEMPNGTGITYDNGAMTWTTKFSYGDISGIALCSTTSGTKGVAGNPDESVGGARQYCWCRATKFQPIGENVVYEPIVPTPWVFQENVQSKLSCLNYCALYCGRNAVQNSTAMRRTMFGIQ